MDYTPQKQVSAFTCLSLFGSSANMKESQQSGQDLNQSCFQNVQYRSLALLAFSCPFSSSLLFAY